MKSPDINSSAAFAESAGNSSFTPALESGAQQKDPIAAAAVSDAKKRVVFLFIIVTSPYMYFAIQLLHEHIIHQFSQKGNIF